MGLSRNAKHDWTDDWTRGETAECRGCGEDWEPLFVGHEPPKWGCGQPSRSSPDPYSKSRERKRRDKSGFKHTYGPIFEAVSDLPCHICGARGTAHHVKTVGAGGRDKNNLVPLCHKHHDEVHRIGRTSFADKYNLDWGKLTEFYYNEVAS